MKYYFEVTLLPSSEISLYFLWEKVYQQVHLALVELKDSEGLVPIGVSFPNYSVEKNHLGNKLRFFAQVESDLVDLNIEKWLFRLMDYLHITKIRSVPEPEGFAIFRRVQTKSSKDRLARRKAKREGITFDKAKELLSAFDEKVSILPYIHTKSLSSSKRYRMMIGFSKVDNSQCGGKFSTYGLSNNCAVPLF